PVTSMSTMPGPRWSGRRRQWRRTCWILPMRFARPRVFPVRSRCRMRWTGSWFTFPSVRPDATAPTGVFMAGLADADVVLIGAGPVALFSVFQLGLYGLTCHLVDSLDRAG